MNKPTLNENWLKNIVLLTINMFLVGIYEEGCFRACACDALLSAFKKCRHPFLLTAVISSLLFGYVHVVRVDFSNTVYTKDFNSCHDRYNLYDSLLENKKSAWLSHCSFSE
ncbi:MAG: CPBP family intramembrane metalloprotease [Erysipelotrichaceae bacterium]|nr:CPBP family intramembrane metalloprotease [Erysipelotrichaceae bacterium]